MGEPTRRRLLASCGLFLAAGSGCSSLFGDGGGGSTPATTPEATPATATTPPRDDAEPGEVVWEREAVGSYPRSPAYHRGRVYVGDYDGALVAVDAATGDPEWSVTVGERLRVSPIGYEDLVFAGPLEGFLRGFDIATGKMRLRISLPRVRDRFGGRTGPIHGFAADAERVYVPVSNSGTLVAIDPADGRVVWSIAGKGTFNTPTIVDGRLYATNIGTEVYSLDPETGDAHWTHEAGHNIQNCTPSVTDDTVAVVSTDGRVRALDRDTGEERWRARPKDRLDDVTATHGRVLAGVADGGLQAMDAATGRVDWTAAFEHEVRDAATVIGETAYVPTYSNEVVACDVESGRVHWETDLASRLRFELATDRTTLYATTRTGGVAAIAR